MLGDPSLSAMEAGALYPGSEHGVANIKKRGGRVKEKKRKGRFLRRAFSFSTVSSSDLSSEEGGAVEESEILAAVPIADDDQLLNATQVMVSQLEAVDSSRRRGAFINHTPRDHESHHSMEPLTSHKPVKEDQFGIWPANGTNSCNSNINNTGSILYDVNFDLDATGVSPVELDGKEVALAVPEDDSLIHRSTSTTDFRDTKKSGKEHTAKTSVCSSPCSLSVSTGAAGTACHPPLEPLVARHRREVTGSDVDVLPPHVDIDDINDTPTFMAVQEYYHDHDQDRHVHSPSSPNSGSNRICRESDAGRVPDQVDGGGGAAGSPLLHELVSSAHGSETARSTAPGLPVRNPDRLTAPSKCTCQATTPRPDEDWDFASAAQGDYSPYHCEAYGPVTPPHMRKKVASGSGGSQSSGAKCSIDISTPRHELLAKEGQLRDLNFFLRNTGPPAQPAKSHKKKGFSFGTLGKKGSDHQPQDVGQLKTGVPPVPALPPMLSVCAREEKTRNGTKYVRIMVPEDCDTRDPVTPPMVNESGQSKRYSINFLFTQEMFNPLGSSPVEDAIAGYTSSPEYHPSHNGSQDTVVHTPRSPKPAPRSPPRVPVESHPLVTTRQEKTRARKLRDLQKIKAATNKLGDEEKKVCDPIKTQRRQKVLVDSKEWVRVQRLNKELARELATIAGLEEGEGNLTPEYVLEVYQMVRRPGY